MVLNDLSVKLTKTIQSMMRRSNLNTDYINKILDEIIQTLKQADIDSEILDKMKQDIFQELKQKSSENNNINLQHYLLQLVHQHLVNLFADTSVKPFIPQLNTTSVIAFYGLQGQGKTTSIVKFGQYYKHKGHKVGVICCDTFRAGAYDQLKQNALSAKLAFYGEKDCKNSIQIAQNGIQFFKRNKINLILIDTSGRHKQSEELIQEMRQLDEAIHPDHSIFVIDASTGKGVKMQAEAFKNAVNLHSIILTKVDGSVTSGGALSAVATLKVPVCFIGTGERLQDFERFNPNSFVNKLMGLGDMESLAEAAIDNKVDSQQQAKNLSDMLQGKFTFLNFQQQITEMLKMGNIEDIMEKMPNMTQIAKEYGFDSEKEGTPALKRWLNMFNSMKKSELQMAPSQFQQLPNYNKICVRIAKGSGYSLSKVTSMVQYAVQMQQQGNKLGSNKFGQAMQQLMQLQSAMKNGQIPPQQMQQAQMAMQQLQKMCQIPGLKPGDDPQQALQLMRQMGLMPETAQMKQVMKHMQNKGKHK